MDCATSENNALYLDFAKHILEVWQARLAMLELAQDSAEKRFLRVCEHLDSLACGTSPKKAIRATIVEHYSHALRLPSHMEELMSLCREHRPGAVWRLGLKGIHHEEYA